jgi:hypothetical protein
MEISVLSVASYNNDLRISCSNLYVRQAINRYQVTHNSCIFVTKKQTQNHDIVDNKSASSIKNVGNPD